MARKKLNVKDFELKFSVNYQPDLPDDFLTHFKVTIPKGWWLSMRKALWKHKIKTHGLFQYIAVLIAMGDDRILSIFEDYKKLKEQEKMIDPRLENADDETLFRIIQEELDKSRNTMSEGDDTGDDT